MYLRTILVSQPMKQVLELQILQIEKIIKSCNVPKRYYTSLITQCTIKTSSFHHNTVSLLNISFSNQLTPLKNLEIIDFRAVVKVKYFPILLSW